LFREDLIRIVLFAFWLTLCCFSPPPFPPSASPADSPQTVLTVLGTWAVVIGSAYSVFGPKSKPKETKPKA